MSGVFFSILFVLFVIIASELLRKFSNSSQEFTRKFIHIGVSHWWLVATYFIDDIKYAVIPPILFMALNYISYKKGLIKSMERGQNPSDLGTVYFPISLAILVLLTWPGGLLGGDYKFLGAVGILTMGYGDGFAAIIGESAGRHKYKIFGNKKSLEGSLAMLLFSFFVPLCVLGWAQGLDSFVLKTSFILAIISTLAEALTPLGLDNISVPLVSTISAHYLLFVVGEIAFTSILFAGIGFIFSFMIAYLAWLKNSLTTDGAIGAVLMGTIMCATSGVYGSSIMILFFFSASVLSHFKKADKEIVALQFEKDGQRDMAQVFANGGMGLIFSICYFFTKNSIYLILMSVAFASANADTWATEIGVLNKLDPISLKTFKRVAKGTSGAVSLMGTLAALGGAFVIGIFSAFALKVSRFEFLMFEISRVPLLVTLGGFFGCMADSILGATVQGVYYDNEKEMETERKLRGGKSLELVRGLSFINNDVVNFTSIAIAALLTVALI